MEGGEEEEATGAVCWRRRGEERLAAVAVAAGVAGVAVEGTVEAEVEVVVVPRSLLAWDLCWASRSPPLHRPHHHWYQQQQQREPLREFKS